jgi:hypothetical protein
MSLGPECVDLYHDIRWTHSVGQIVNEVLRAAGGSRTLELSMPGTILHDIEAAVRHVVSPHEGATFEMDEIEFAHSGRGEPAYDVVIVDCVHEADRCLAAMEWALGRVAPHGAIVVHDTNPPTAWHQRPSAEYVPGTDWNGDVWKAVVRFRARHPEMYVATVDTDWGCTVVRPGAAALDHLDSALPDALTWDGFERNRSSWLNLISVRRLRRDLFYLPRVSGRAPLAGAAGVSNVLISRFGLESYLDIGGGDSGPCFEGIIAPVRHRVDPNGSGTFAMSPDEFFERGVGCPRYDVVLVDGWRDVEHALRRLSPRGFVVVRDAKRSGPLPPACDVSTIDVDGGCTILHPTAAPSRKTWLELLNLP